MQGHPQPTAAARPTRSAAFLVSALLAGHSVSTMALLALPAVAPAVADDYGIDASLIGYQISLASIGMLGALSVLGNTTRRLGGARTNQIGHLMVACGMLLLLLPWIPFLVAGSVVAGVGYGLLTPSASYLLVRYTPAARRNLIFSLHQLGIPVGGILAALIAPAIAVTAGWRWAVALTIVMLVLILWLMQRGRSGWDADRDRTAPVTTATPLAGMRTIWAHRPLRLASLAGACFSWAQFCTATFAVVACVTALDMSLVAAGTVLTVVQIASALGRVIVGWLVDYVQQIALVLAWVAGVMLLSCIAALAMSPSLPLVWVYVLFAMLGGASGAWPGAILAEVGRLAPNNEVSLAISGSMIFTNSGKFIGPIVFANVYALSQSYGIAFASVAVPSAVCVWCLLAMHRYRDG